MRHQNYYFYATLNQNYTWYLFIIFIGTIIIYYFLLKMWEHIFVLYCNSVPTWNRRLCRWMGRGEECIWFYGEFVVYFTKFQQRFVIHKSLFLKFLRIFFLAKVSGRDENDEYCWNWSRKFSCLLSDLINFWKSQKDGLHPILRK